MELRLRAAAPLDYAQINEVYDALDQEPPGPRTVFHDFLCLIHIRETNENRIASIRVHSYTGH